MSEYAIKVWCRDCTGQDKQGCNDGRPWFVHDADYERLTFATRGKAEQYIEDDPDGQLDCDVWESEIVEVES